MLMVGRKMHFCKYGQRREIPIGASSILNETPIVKQINNLADLGE